MNKLLASLQVWWLRITPREQRLVMVGGVALIIGILFWGIYQPMVQRAELAQNQLRTEKQLLSWVQNKADDIVALRGNGARALSPLPFNQAVSSSARRFNIELVRVQPRGEEMQVWVQPLPFNQLVSWLEYLQQNHGVEAQFLDIDKNERVGVVDVKRLQLSKG
ncbi:type II secretion system protein M [Vibrio scophthalmi]|uniref:Type II secretion system protein M n=2 Tax=Vibrio scophthalmi TaxID=45658 RepID=F9RQW4_9VIBR|nr:type II secretion system protein M [Vibrio scophthalmi]EGU33550.1 general secretion pathway protein M [Vibrio scophthalmi LMG 19158]ODS09875.1 Type II secretion system protein M [Vibrio scophthalmi]